MTKRAGLLLVLGATLLLALPVFWRPGGIAPVDAKDAPLPLGEGRPALSGVEGVRATTPSLDEDSRARMVALAAASPDPDIRWSATKLLLKAEDPDSLFLLQDRMIKDPEPTVRMNAIQALVDLEDPAAIPVLAEGLKDPNPKVRAAAKAALKKSGD